MSIGEHDLKRVAELMAKAHRPCVLTGAGVSAESGIPTFRGAGGFWKNEREVQKLATLQGFLEDPKRVWEWYDLRRAQAKSVKPNPGHYAIAEWEQRVLARGGEFALITQNIDDLHNAAGTRRVIELHGNIQLARCIRRCTAELTPLPDPPLSTLPPRCERCGDILRPHVVWFGEQLDPAIIDEAARRADDADLMLVVGTSAKVYPAAALPYSARARGATVVEINLEPTELTSVAQFTFHGKSGEVFPRLMGYLKEVAP